MEIELFHMYNKNNCLNHLKNQETKGPICLDLWKIIFISTPLLKITQCRFTEEKYTSKVFLGRLIIDFYVLAILLEILL